MPLTAKGQEILANMKQQYGPEKGEEVFYASANAGKITGVHDRDGAYDAMTKVCDAFDVKAERARLEKAHHAASWDEDLAIEAVNRERDPAKKAALREQVRVASQKTVAAHRALNTFLEGRK